MIEECARCRFWLQVSEAEGLCRRFPAVPMAVPSAPDKEGGIASVFPRMMTNGWCGEFKRVAVR